MVVKRLLALMLLLSASGASAQSVFVQGTVGAEIRRFSGEAGTSIFDATTRAFAIGIGGLIMPHWSLGVEVDFGGRSSATTTTIVAISGQPRNISTTYSSERRSLSALAGYQTSVHRGIQFGYYIGLTFSTFSRAVASDADQVILQAAAPGSLYSDRLSNAILGVDAAIRVAPHVWLVPAVRVQALPIGADLNGHSVRPSLGVRVTF